MGVRKIGEKFYIFFNWKGNRIQTVTSASTETEAKKLEKQVKTAFYIFRFDHLEPKALEVTLKIFEIKKWKLPDELSTPEPERELTLLHGIRDYLDASGKNRTERKMFSLDRIVEYLGENTALESITALHVRKYRDYRLNMGISNATVNIETSTLSGIFRVQLEKRTLEFNPCSMLSRLPETQRDVYVSWEEFQKMLNVAGWLKPIISILYYTGMRPSEVFELDWKEIDFVRRMIVLPPERTKEGKNANQKWLREKRIHMRHEVCEILLGIKDAGSEKPKGRVFTHRGRDITRDTKRKCWASLIRKAGLKSYQIRDFRRSFKTNLAWSGVDRTIRNAIVGHSSNIPVEDRYIHLTDERLLEAVDKMKFDHQDSPGSKGEFVK